MKKKDIKSILLVSFLVLILVLIMSLTVFNPPLNGTFNFNEASKTTVSTVINNLTTPIISFISVILLYITLNKQIDSMYDQRRSKNLDLVLSIYNQLENEYTTYSYVKRGMTVGQNATRYENTYAGFEALYNSLASVKRQPEKFGKTYQSDKMIGLIYTYDLLFDVLETLDMEEKVKSAIVYKMENFYTIKMRSIYLHVAFLVRNYDNKNSKAIVQFVQTQERRFKNDFDIYAFKTEGELFKDDF